jgi:hypothetical protein
MGHIFHARDHVTGNTVAVKVLLGHPHPGAEARFVREASILADLSHPGIVRYIAHGEAAAGEQYLVMEWLDGEDLKSRLARAPLTLAESVTLGRHVAEALGAAHAQGVVHRDLKPSNLFLPDGRVERTKVLDFGIAWRADGAHLTHPGQMIGTPGYMAPEQARSASSLDARTDVFSLGCVLFRCLTGEMPFGSDSLMAVLAKILCDEAPNVRAYREDVPPALDALVTQMLLKDPDRRPRDGTAVAAALEALGPLVSSAAPPQAAPCRAAQPALTGNEQCVLSLVLVGPSACAAEDRTSVHEGPPADDGLLRTAELHGGHLERLADGSFLVIFTGERPVATDQAARAAYCALALREICPDRQSAVSTRRAELTGALRVGGAIDRAASRLLRLPASVASAAAAPIALDEMSARLLETRFEVGQSEAGPVLLGKREPGHGARLLLGKPTPCIGREREILILEALLEAAASESSAHAMLVTAPAGMGKSRLASELVNRVRRRGALWAVWIARGDPLRASSSLELLAQALRSALGIREGEAYEARRDQLSARVAEHVAATDRRHVAEFLGELVGTPFTGNESVSLSAARKDAQLMSEQTRKAWIDFLRAETGARPVLLVLDDLHWGDTGTVRYIDAALRDLADAPWVVLALARPEVRDLFPRLWAERDLQEVRLKEISRAAATRLVRQVLGDGPNAAAVDELVQRADGNPFYLEEQIRSVSEGKGAAPPETVLAMVQARLSRLEGEARRVLRAASVFGEACWPSAVACLLDRPAEPTQVAEWLSLLVEREVLVRRPDSRFEGEHEFAFRHTLLRDGAHAMLTEDDLRRGHLRAGEWLEQRGEADAAVLARHFELGGERARGGALCLRAAGQALHRGDLDAAEALAERALASGITGALRLECLGVLCETHSFRFGWEEAAAYAAEVIRTAEPGRSIWLRAAAAQLTAEYRLGHPEACTMAFSTLMSVPPAPEAASTAVQSFALGVLIACLLAELTIAEALLRRVDGLAAVCDSDPVARAMMRAAHVYWEACGTGDMWAALDHVDAALESFEAAGELRQSRYLRAVAGMIRWRLGMLAEAEAVLRAPAGDPDSVAALLQEFYLALVLLDRGKLDEVREIATRRIARARSRPGGLDAMRDAEGRWMLGEITRKTGDLAAAEREMAAAVETLRVHPFVWQLAAPALVAVRLDLGRVAEALALERELMRVMAARPPGGWTLPVRLMYAECLHASGEGEAARALLAAACDDLRAMAARIGDPEVRHRFLTEVREHARLLALAADPHRCPVGYRADPA